MMRIAVSDYDGTMTDKRKPRGDIVTAITRWRTAGNLFGIATGRDYTATVFETDRWGIPVDFLICNNGATIHDADGSLLQKRLFPDGLLPDVLRHPAALASMHYQLCGTDPLRVYLREGSWFPLTGIPYAEVDFEDALEARELGQIGLAYHDEEVCREWGERLRDDLGGRLGIHRNRVIMDLTMPGVDKASAVECLLAIKGWDESRVVTVGDGGNDVGMIKRFGGYTVSGGAAEAAAVARAAFADVPELLESLME